MLKLPHYFIPISLSKKTIKYNKKYRDDIMFWKGDQIQSIVDKWAVASFSENMKSEGHSKFTWIFCHTAFQIFQPVDTDQWLYRQSFSFQKQIECHWILLLLAKPVNQLTLFNMFCKQIYTFRFSSDNLWFRSMF